MKLFVLPLGICDVDKGAVLTPGSGDGERVTIPIVAYLIETDDDRRILVDTGMHRRHIDDPGSTYGGTEFGKVLTPIMTPADDIVNRLAEIGVTPDQIDILVVTHFHFDHAGSNSDFTRSRVLVQQEALEWERSRPEGSIEEMWNQPLTYEPFTGDLEIAPGVTLLESGGHVPGHCSVLVKFNEDSAILLAIDAIYTRENLDSAIWSGYYEPERAKATADRLVAIAKANNAELIFGHDPAQWATLRKSPDYYDGSVS